MTVSVGSTITTSSYNSIFEEISKILNPTIGGYGANIRASSTATTNIVASYEHWNALYSDVNKSIKHQTGSDIPGISAPSVSALITANFVNTLATAATTAVTNSLTVHVSQLTAYNSSTTFIDIPWNSQIQNDRTFTWDSGLIANYHFNLGGYIRSTIGSSGTVASVGDQGYVEFVAHANSPYSTLITDPYTRARWLGPFGTTVTNYSTSTSAGIFTATVTYVRGTDNVAITTEVFPPVAAGTISLFPISTGTLFYSTDAISAQRPSIAIDRKILEVNSLQPFNFRAGKRSNPQMLTLSNVGAEPVTVSSVFATSFGVISNVVSTATNLSAENPIIIPLSLPVTIAPNEDYNAVVFYAEPNRAVTEIGKFYNSVIIVSDADAQSIVVPTEQNVGAPEFDFFLDLTDLGQEYTYTSWQTEYGLNDAQKALGINIANTYYLSNSSFGVVAGKQRYGLYRKPDASGLKFWVDYTNANYSGDYTQIAAAFFGAVDASSIETNRSLTSEKFFDSGYGYGDFYDKSLVDVNIVNSTPKKFHYNIRTLFGSLNVTSSSPGYTVTLSNQLFNGSPSDEAVSAFSVDPKLSGPDLFFYPLSVNNIGAYSTDVTVTVSATDSTGAQVSKSKTVNLSLNLQSLVDGNLVKWVSGFETNNGVMGMSYDRIGGKLYLTVGLGSGADGAPTLDANNYLPTYVSADNLGINADLLWSTREQGYNLPMYRIAFPSSWGTFMNNYGVWPVNPTNSSGGSYGQGVYISRKYKFTAPSSGTYTVEFAVDDYGYVSIDGNILIDRRFASKANFQSSQVATVSLTQGKHEVELYFQNGVSYSSGNPGGVATTIKDPSNYIVWSTLEEIRSTPPYLYWPEVYRIPIDANVEKTYQLKDYLVKNNFPVNGYPSGYFTYSDFFGTSGTANARSFITIGSDGKGNLSFGWNPQTTSSSDDSANVTMSNMPSLPYVFSYFKTRKRNVEFATGGQTSQKLVGMTVKGPKYALANTPGFGIDQGVSAFISGVPGSGRSASIAPGRQYNVSENSYVDIGYYAPVSRHWIADQVGGGRQYSASRALAFIHPRSVITQSQIESWGFDYSDVISARDIRLSRVRITQDHYTEFWYGILQSGDASMNDRPPVDTSQRLLNLYHPQGGRGYFDVYGPWNLPDPSPNQLIYMIVVDQTGGARGFNDCTLDMGYTYVPFTGPSS